MGHVLKCQVNKQQCKIRTYIASVCIRFTLRLEFTVVNSSFVHKYGQFYDKV